MKKKSLFFLCSFLCLIFLCTCQGNAENTQLSVPSQITNVTVYTDGALITRTGNIDLEKGTYALRLTVDATHIDTDSAQSSITGKGEILGVQCTQVFLNEPEQEALNKITTEIENLEKQKSRQLAEKEVFEKKEAFVNACIDFSAVEIPKEMQTTYPSTASLLGTLDFIEENFRTVKNTQIAITENIAELDTKILRAKKEQAQLKTTPDKQKWEIIITFRSESKQTITVNAQYMTPRAHWTPIYKVAAPYTRETIQLSMLSSITQTTGEDWNDVTCTISNVQPLRTAVLPHPNTWCLALGRESQTDEKRMRRAMFSGGMMEISAAEPMASYDEESLPQAQYTETTRRELPLAFEYDITDKTSIDSKKTETQLPLWAKEVTGSFYYYVAPKLNQQAFLVADIATDEELLPAPINVYFGDSYIGKTILQSKKAGESFTLNLGADRNIRVKREKLVDKIKETMLFGKLDSPTITREYRFKITVENTKKEAATIHIVDTLPVSNTDKIIVKDIVISDEPTTRNYKDREGVCLWTVNLSPNETKEITYSFTITYPKDSPVIGL